MMKYSLSMCLMLFVLVNTVGCSGEPKPAGFPKLYPVSVRVTQEGKPLDGATIQLLSGDSASSWTTGGTTDARGIAVFWTHGKFKGAPLGKYKVTVTKEVKEGEKEYNEAMDRQDTAAAAKIRIHAYTFVEENYTRFDKTPLEIEITKGGTIDIDAGKAVKIEQPYMR